MLISWKVRDVQTENTTNPMPCGKIWDDKKSWFEMFHLSGVFFPKRQQRCAARRKMKMFSLRFFVFCGSCFFSMASALSLSNFLALQGADS